MTLRQLNSLFIFCAADDADCSELGEHIFPLLRLSEPLTTVIFILVATTVTHELVCLRPRRLSFGLRNSLNLLPSPHRLALPHDMRIKNTLIRRVAPFGLGVKDGVILLAQTRNTVNQLLKPDLDVVAPGISALSPR
jgi:hypothetical protein